MYVKLTNATASSTDTLSAQCLNDNCTAARVIDTSSAEYWQSAADPKCSDQWIQASIDADHLVSNLTITYGSMPPPAGNPVQILLNPESMSPSNVTTPKSVCEIKTTAPHLLETCILGEATPAHSIRLTWQLSNGTAHNGECQMNVNDLTINGEPVSQKPNNTSVPALPPANNPIDPTQLSDNPEDPTPQSVNGISAAAIVGITVTLLCIAVGAILYVIRQKNLKKRQRKLTETLVNQGDVPPLEFVELYEQS
ncbi:hypothetical protein BJ741DRAFT_624499 [Chytriomyces cf. hyalinus JEL632]|nr:hypothetical protein BJ741DRAFT_624499 [Chytriomyces cf. hyalinus JEL632]